MASITNNTNNVNNNSTSPNRKYIDLLNNWAVKKKEELEGFEQCWLTGTAAEVTPVGQIGDYTFEVGALTKEISNSYDKLVRS